MKKYILDLTLSSNEEINSGYFLMKLTAAESLPPMIPGQFVEIKVEQSPQTFLRRPISINFVDTARNELWLLIHVIGEGTRTLSTLVPGDKMNVILPLGNGFSMPENPSERILLIGGGVGTAPLLYMGDVLKKQGFTPEFLLGARSGRDLMQIELFKSYGKVYITTEDGSVGEKGFVTQHSVLNSQPTFRRIYTCGPKPMMQAVAKYAKARQIECEVSLENTMACGLGACLCCVEKTTAGHVCVCTEGPIFNINQLSWQI